MYSHGARVDIRPMRELVLTNRELITSDRIMEVVEIIRRRKKMKIQELAEKSGLSRGYIGSVLTGDIDFKISTLEKMLDGLSITFDEFLAHLVRFSDIPDERVRRVVKEEVEKISGPGGNH